MVRRHVGFPESAIASPADMLAIGHGEKLYVKAICLSPFKNLADHYAVVMFGAFATGWGVPAIALAIALIFSGVSFRFGGKSTAPKSPLQIDGLISIRNMSYQSPE